MPNHHNIIGQSLEGKTISIIGKGNFGGLLYDLFTKKFRIDPQQILTYDPEKSCNSSLNTCYSANYIFLCTPLSVFSQTLVDLIKSEQYQKSQGIIIDTCSIKEQPKRYVEKLLLTYPKLNIRIIHGHGMRGPNSIKLDQEISKQQLKTVFTSYHGIADQEADNFIEGVKELGFDCVTMTEDEHDLQAAISQFRTYLIARVARSAGFDKQFFDENKQNMGFNKELFETCKIFDEQDSLFEPYALYNTHCKAVIEHIHQGAIQIEQWLKDNSPTQHYFGTLGLPKDRTETKKKGDIVAAFFKTLLMDNWLLTATSIDTKNAQRINAHLNKALSLKELPYSKEEIQEQISGLVQAAKQETEKLIQLINKGNHPIKDQNNSILNHFHNYLIKLRTIVLSRCSIHKI